MGVGARRAVNLLNGRFRSQGVGAQDYVDLAVGFRESRVHARNFRQALRQETERIQCLEHP